jgi:hypothetical protein
MTFPSSAGADYVGPLPAELQGYVDFAVGVLAVSKRSDAAQALVIARGRAPHPHERHGAAAALAGYKRSLRETVLPPTATCL